ncbi:MAG: hypothetical protein WC817_02595 [Patescibacteria group bacterium]|jgi:hypothetical protein
MSTNAIEAARQFVEGIAEMGTTQNTVSTAGEGLSVFFSRMATKLDGLITTAWSSIPDDPKERDDSEVTLAAQMEAWAVIRNTMEVLADPSRYSVTIT